MQASPEQCIGNSLLTINHFCLHPSLTSGPGQLWIGMLLRKSMRISSGSPCYSSCLLNDSNSTPLLLQRSQFTTAFISSLDNTEFESGKVLMRSVDDTCLDNFSLSAIFLQVLSALQRVHAGDKGHIDHQFTVDTYGPFLSLRTQQVLFAFALSVPSFVYWRLLQILAQSI